MDKQMTDEQFEVYNKLCNFIDELIEKFPEDEKITYRQKKADILMNNTTNN